MTVGRREDDGRHANINTYRHRRVKRWRAVPGPQSRGPQTTRAQLPRAAPGRCWAVVVLLVTLASSAAARHLIGGAIGGQVGEGLVGQEAVGQGQGPQVGVGAGEGVAWSFSKQSEIGGKQSGAGNRSDQGAGGASDGEPAPFKYPVWWLAPFWSGSGYSSEASNYMLSMLRARTVREKDLWIGHHGDTVRQNVKDAMDAKDRKDLEAMEGRISRTRPAIVVCHSLPSNWMYPSPMGWAGAKCPPDPKEFPYVYTIGRTMFETDRLPPAFVVRCNAMNEVWVPSTFSRDVFAASGVLPSKLRVVPEGINTTLFDPARHAPMPLPEGDLVFGTPAPVEGTDSASSHSSSLSSSTSVHPSTGPGSSGANRGQDAEAGASSDGGAASSPRPFRFLSTFKWEARKGWDVLLGAYLTAFSAQDPVELYIITKPFQGSDNFVAQMHMWAERQWGTWLRAAAVRAQEQSAVAAAGVGAVNPDSAAKGIPSEPQTAAHPATSTVPGKAHGRHAAQAAASAAAALQQPNPSQAPGELPQSSRPLAHQLSALQQLQESVRMRGDAGHSNNSTASGSKSLAVEPGLPRFNASLLPRVYVVHHHVADADWARYYASVDAFVLPSRGEGWGRPHVEAMAMGLPVLSTNWSGITAYLDDKVGYPITVERLVPADPSVWWFRGLRWAQPSRDHLTQLMRHVVTHREEAAAKGAAARARMVEKFSPEPIARLLAEELRRVDALIPQ